MRKSQLSSSSLKSRVLCFLLLATAIVLAVVTVFVPLLPELQTRHARGSTPSAEVVLSPLDPVRTDPYHTITVATVSDGFYDFTMNWLCWLGKLPTWHPYLFLATDEAVFEKLKKMNQPVYLLEVQTGSGTPDRTAYTYGTLRYQELMHTRTLFMKSLLDQGYNVLIADIDALLFQDPFPYMGPLMENHEILYADDNSDTNRPYACGGFFWMRSVPQVRQFWGEVARRHGELIEKCKVGETLGFWRHYHPGDRSSEFCGMGQQREGTTTLELSESPS
ncbi:hypothetical protein PAPYR_9234 [Paratrimastix pyriformis]|uniref:Nucleotide-diphospho-sugar transferase domain-containing protein n=1 Tax=Paratrimastix pyriformis TaxID=342808 RepID=A0ABQ8U8W8_9EUKA|nr:hypothetical protein PAPYR_9234 [Paratrimastix pyriformis]